MPQLRAMDATLGGYPWLPRMIDKARAARAGTLGSYVHPCPVDRTCLARMRLGFDAFSAVIARTETDAEVLRELRALGIASPAQAWFDPVALEAALQRGVLELPVGEGEPRAERDEGAAERAAQPGEHARA